MCACARVHAPTHTYIHTKKTTSQEEQISPPSQRPGTTMEMEASDTKGATEKGNRTNTAHKRKSKLKANEENPKNLK